MSACDAFSLQRACALRSGGGLLRSGNEHRMGLNRVSVGLPCNRSRGIWSMDGEIPRLSGRYRHRQQGRDSGKGERLDEEADSWKR